MQPTNEQLFGLAIDAELNAECMLIWAVLVGNGKAKEWFCMVGDKAYMACDNFLFSVGFDSKRHESQVVALWLSAQYFKIKQERSQ